VKASLRVISLPFLSKMPAFDQSHHIFVGRSLAMARNMAGLAGHLVDMVVELFVPLVRRQSVT